MAVEMLLVYSKQSIDVSFEEDDDDNKDNYLCRKAYNPK